MDTPLIEARALCKTYGDLRALDGFDLTLAPGQILGLIGPNGSGKTTAIKTLLGLARRSGGEIRVLGVDPFAHRPRIMSETAYIADTGILPRWMKIGDLIDCFAGLHPSFDRQRLDEILSATEIRRERKVQTLSKGMNVQLHLALIMAIDARLLVLDEPTLGLDQIYRQRFYNMLLNDFAREDRSILITTHEVREVQHLLTDVVFIEHGRNRLDIRIPDIANRFARLMTSTTNANAARALAPLNEVQTPHGVIFIYDGVDPARLAGLGEVGTPDLAELFVAIVGGGR
jgi:ABC-2 type transport system ATP-binding protein